MTSNIRLQRVCQFCGSEFIAKTTTTQYCSSNCAKRAYKAGKRNERIGESIQEAQIQKTLSIKHLQEKEFLSVKEVATLIGCSVRTAYRLINEGTLSSVNLSERMTRVKRTEVDRLMEPPTPYVPKKPVPNYKISDCYNLTEVQERFGVSEKGLYSILKRNNIPKIKKGKFTYVPKKMIDELLT